MTKKKPPKAKTKENVNEPAFRGVQKTIKRSEYKRGPKLSREDTNQTAYRVMQEVIRKSES